MDLARMLIKIVATLFFSGYAPVAPGTAGTALVAVIYFLSFSSLDPVNSFAWLIILATASGIAVFSAEIMSREWGKDPDRVVVDEGVGFLFSVALLPVSIMTTVLGFFVFRLLDIIKPVPARQLERLPGGWGIVADDIIAGIYTNIVLQVIFYFFSGLWF